MRRSTIAPFLAGLMIAGAGTALPLTVNTSGLGPSWFETRHDHVATDRTVEVRLMDLRGFEVLRTGDARGEGEIHLVEVSLSTRDEAEYFELAAISLFNDSQDEGPNPVYLGAATGDQIRIRGRVVDPETRSPTIRAARDDRITVAVRTRELDCTRQRLCNRGNTGTFDITVTLPELPARLPPTCEPEFTFSVTTLDGFAWIRDTLDQMIGGSAAPRLRPTFARLCVRAPSP